MLILHCAIKGERLALWAETSELGIAHEPRAAEAQRSTQHVDLDQADEVPCRRQPEPHSFAASVAHIQSALSDADLPLVFSPDQRSVVVITVIESEGVPLASTPMIGRSIEDADPATLRLAPWVVPSIALDIEQMIELCCYCMDDAQLAPGLLAGQDLRFWAQATRFAGKLVGKQQFLPGLRLTSQGALASWDPVFIGEDGETLSQLAKGLPGSCLSAEVDAFDDTFSKRAFDILVKFISQVADHLVKTGLKGRVPLHVMPLIDEGGADHQNIHQRWIDALVGGDPKLQGTPEEFAKLSAQIAEWRRPLAVASDAPYRLCLRLEEPRIECTAADDSAPDVVSSGEGPWYVRFLLQSLRDQGVLVPIETVLSPSFEELPLLRGGRVSAREYAFRSLGQAVRLCPEIEQSFTDVVPRGFELSTDGAHKFLSQTAPALKNAGFSVQLPGWWTKNRKIKAKAKMNGMNQGTLFSLKDLAEFDWQLALGTMPMSIEELEKLAQLKAPLVRWQGMWLEMNQEQIAPILKFFATRNQRQVLSHQDLINLTLGAKSLPGGVEFDGVTGEGRIVDVISQLQGQSEFEERLPHHRFEGELRPYQIRGMSWLAFLQELGFGACLADDMGLGKTVQTLAFIQRRWYEQKKGHRHPTLLVCPTSVIGNWHKEAAKFTPDLEVHVHHGTDRLRGGEFVRSARQCSMVITSYALLHKDYDALNSLPWHLIILDEAQNVKNPETNQAIAACSLRSDFRIALTGTPVENSVADLWSLMNFLNPGLLGSRNSFKEQYFKPIQIFQEQEKLQQLKRLTGPFILRRLKTDKSIVPDLPEKFERKTRCHLTREQASLYAAVANEATDALDVVGGMKRKSLVLTTMLRLKQICDHPALLVKGTNRDHHLRSGKLKRLTEMLEAVLSNDERALIFTQFSHMGELIQSHLQHATGKEVLFLHGATARDERERMVERFQSARSGSPQLFVLSLKAGGTGLNLTKANHVFHFDRWWNPAVENQATDRAFRIGQGQDVSVYKFICAGTLEENIDEIIERKKVIASNTVGAGEGWLTELSTKELRKIFSLKETALVD